MLNRAFQTCLKVFGLPVRSRAVFSCQQSKPTSRFYLTDRLHPFVDGDGYPPIPVYSELWAAIGGVRGVLHMNVASMAAAWSSAALRDMNPRFTAEPASEVFWGAIRLWFTTWKCLIEAGKSTVNPSNPRRMALRCAWIYCEMASSIEMLQEFSETPNGLKTQ